MLLQAFSFPVPETRFFKAGSFIYKFKIRGGTSYSSQEDVMGEVVFNQELEEIIRTVLGNLDDLQPFSSTHYTVFPYKKRRECVCKHDEMNLRVYPFTLIIYLEKNRQNASSPLISKTQGEKGRNQGAAQSVEENGVTQHIPSISEPQSKRCKRDSPLEEAILKDLIKDMEAENRVAVTGKLDLGSQHSQEKIEEDPGHTDKNKGASTEEATSNHVTTRHHGKSMIFSDLQQQQPETVQEEEGTPETPVRPGYLKQLASCIFPFSWFFNDPEN